VNVVRVTGRGDAGEHSRGRGGFFSGMLQSPCLVDNMIFTFVVPTQQVSSDGTLLRKNKMMGWIENGP